MKKKLLAAVFSVFLLIGEMHAQVTSDSIHVRHYSLTIDSIAQTAQQLYGRANASVYSKVNGLNVISLLLLNFSIDSIATGTQNLSYSYNDTLLRISTSAIMNTGDSEVIDIFYHGHPLIDASNWGGFYFNSNYAFNLGVGFDANPHCFGRAWFPCMDDFVEKSSYEFHITTPDTCKAFCNGILQLETNNGDGTKTWDWIMNQNIPSYLVGIAVAPFYTINRTYSGIPCELAVMPGDSAITISSFGHIGTAVSAFISDYGPYPFDKIGYVMTPVIYGGMEHASSIHVSKAFVDGTFSNETLYAHELSHMWWGDNVTCKTENEMWLNEGFATFNEHVYTEAQYSSAAYKTSYHTDHREVLQFAHITDGAYYAQNNVPHSQTYATLSVYKKGALTAHTLRKYMGDAAFFQGCRDYHHNLAYGNANSTDFKNQLAASSGINLDDFFNDWVFTPGFPQFSIDSSTVVANGGHYDISIYTRQKQKGNAHTYKMNVEFNFTDGVNDSNVTFLCDQPTNSFQLSLPFSPTLISVDRNEKMMDAITDFENIISATGTVTFPETNVSLNVQNSGSASSLVRVEHNWVKADDYKYNPGIRVSDYHYWKVDGLFSSGFHSKATFIYDGSLSTSNGCLDNTLITGAEDSLVILYRPSTAEDWRLVNGYTKNMGSHTDKRGNIVIDTLKKGEYVLGFMDYSVRGIAQGSLTKKMNEINAFPNPSTGIVNFNFSLSKGKNGYLKITDIFGKEVFSVELNSSQTSFQWDSSPYLSGTYFVQIFCEGKSFETAKALLLK